jgi:hypothetical protein
MMKVILEQQPGGPFTLTAREFPVSTMPRYYIDVRGHFGTNEDPSGVELPNVAAAKAEALKIAESLAEGWAGLVPRYCNEIVVEVRDEDLRPILTIPYSEIALDAQASSLLANSAGYNQRHAC